MTAAEKFLYGPTGWIGAGLLLLLLIWAVNTWWSERNRKK